MLIRDYKLRVSKTQAAAIAEAIRTMQFIRNTDSEGNTVANPRSLRKAEKHLKRLQHCLDRKKKG